MRFRKLPVEVEAVQFFEAMEYGQTPPGVRGYFDGGGQLRRYVVTVHGERAHLADGDWVITEPDGMHHYPCKPDIFAATYTPVPEPPDPAEAVVVLAWRFYSRQRYACATLDEARGFIVNAIEDNTSVPYAIARADGSMLVAEEDFDRWMMRKGGLHV